MAWLDWLTPFVLCFMFIYIRNFRSVGRLKGDRIVWRSNKKLGEERQNNRNVIEIMKRTPAWEDVIREGRKNVIRVAMPSKLINSPSRLFILLVRRRLLFRFVISFSFVFRSFASVAGSLSRRVSLSPCERSRIFPFSFFLLLLPCLTNKTQWQKNQQSTFRFLFEEKDSDGR